MAEKKSGRQKHTCPKLPSGFKQFQTPRWDGESFAVAKRKWAAYVRRVQRVRPTPRKTMKEKGE